MILPESSSVYQSVEDKLEASDSLVKVILLIVAAVAVYIALQPSKSLRLAAALWFTLP